MMKKLTEKQMDKLWGYCGETDEQYGILHNGETGYCKETKTVITCCGNCGDYTRVKQGNLENATQKDFNEVCDAITNNLEIENEN